MIIRELIFCIFTALLYGVLQYFRVSPIDSLSNFDFMEFLRCYTVTPGGESLTAYDLTMFFTLFVFLQFWNLFNARAFESGHTAFHDARHSLVFFSTLAVIFVGQIAIVYVGGAMFNVCAIAPSDLALIIVFTSPVMLIPTAYGLIRKLKH